MRRFLILLVAAMAVVHICAQIGLSSVAAAGGPEVKAGWAGGFSDFRDNLMKERTGGGWEYRKKVLLEYGTAVRSRNEAALREWRDNDDAASRAFRGKTALVFDALRRLVGQDAFSRIAENLSGAAGAASWDDIKALVAKETGQDLGWFFSQWVDRKGLPDLVLEDATVRRRGDGFEVVIDLVQKGEVYVLDIPILISYLRGGSKSETVHMDSARKHAVFLFTEEPAEIAVDPDYLVPRELTGPETPSLLARVLTNDAVI
ncbi:MAG TPA: hypothetical protein VIX18_03995, partial [Nitrospirota bacterium]